jgi:hypothetical protein
VKKRYEIPFTSGYCTRAQNISTTNAAQNNFPDSLYY